MHRRPHKIDREATRAANFESRYSYVSTRLHPETSHQCVYLAGNDTEARRRMIFERDDYKCQDCGKVVPWDGDLTQRGHLAHSGNTKVTRCWCPEALKTKCWNCHMGPMGHNREVKWSFGIGRVSSPILATSGPVPSLSGQGTKQAQGAGPGKER